MKNARVHDHRWNMASCVLLGKVHHSTYTLQYSPHGNYSVKEAPGASNKECPLIEIPGSRCYLKNTGHNMLAAGSSYTFPRRQFHESGHTGLTLTLIHKTYATDNPARIISPCGEVPDHAFLDQPSYDDLWDAFEDAYKQYLNL